ncbi:alpha/beta hydrolase [Aestuariivirga sp.]|uniref:alpha/beta hydrolase n=1 Tax=Aestuariivirga sp. TaxID=2650926 RepID=UPI003593C8CE
MTQSPAPFTDRPLLSGLHPLGIVLGALAFLAALSPSLIPRTGLLQGVVAGLAFAALYGAGVLLGVLWTWLELPAPGKQHHGIISRVAMVLAALIILYGLSSATDWQNAIHEVMKMPPVESARPFTIAGVSLAVMVIILFFSRLFRRATIIVAARMGRLVPQRIAYLGGFVTACLVFWMIGNGVLVNGAFRVLDGMYRRVDALIPPDFNAPADPFKTGSPASLVSWESLGAQGRERVATVPAQADIADITGQAANEPLRVYVGLNSGEDPQQRAELALAEMIRIGAFERAAVVIATPTGTGWVDPSGMAPVEILLRGDVASVSVQYSYLPSWLALLVNPEYGAETAQAVFRSVYGHWRNLPRDTRPKLYLFGLSLGSLNSDISADFFDIVGDPYNGALWVGPPFASRTWNDVTAQRDKSSPAWLPRFRDGSLFRFTSQVNALNLQGSGWGPVRMVYLQYASDPITFFETASLWRRPAWMIEPRGPDVSPRLAWVPVVTFLQLLCDMMTATTTPRGVGHVYAGKHYLDGWAAVTESENWTEADLERVRTWLAKHDL